AVTAVAATWSSLTMDDTVSRRRVDRGRLVRVEPVQAHRIADEFLAAPRISFDPVVHAAYDDLATQAGRWFDRLTGGAVRAPFRVAYTQNPEPYSTGTELAQRVRRERVLELWPSR